MYELANYLRQPLTTILSMTDAEFKHWFTFLRLKEEQNGNTSS
jgi:hypothetical protein